MFLLDIHPNIIVAFLLSLIISIYITRSVIRYSLRVGLGDKPGESRKIHTKRTPNMGGIAVFIATFVSYFAFVEYQDTIRPDKIFSICILLFFVGVKDDLEPISPKFRLFVEFALAFFVIYISDIRLVTLWGIFGIQILPLWASYILSATFIVACINAYNLIDGIDGLLGSISLLGAICFGLLFNFLGDWLWTLLCVSLTGALIGFLIFNWHPAKVFMGNGGALFLGAIFACFSLRLMQMTDPIYYETIQITAPHTLAFSIVAIPFVDLLCVFSYRILHWLPPFAADNSHIHHRMLRIGLKHDRATISLIVLNIIIIAFAFLIQGTGALRSFIFTVCFAVAVDIIFFYIEWQIKIYKRRKSLKA
ncbi:undecaprenyl/decaprenyl-phosphate alpha-N-acetylglucosaminyl 1-phosphate transferase [Bacteroidales bacterium OttesenSCG-928-M11]|nr:undecaprenyl/decaprenyl-phosphate alpha-N-acetylglucosaminyl 1-phosphate transferase [Bacteroidales bacterium OttesenSCG-928-M11]